MKKTIEVDPELLKKARKESGAATDEEAIRRALQELVRAGAYRRLAEYGGSEPNALDVPRRREKPASKRRIA